MTDCRRFHGSPDRMSVFVGLVVVVLIFTRAASELAMMSVHGPDPQMPIWHVILVVKLGFWLTCGLIAWLTLVFWRTRIGLAVGLMLLAGWGFAVGWSAWQYQRGWRALADASNPATSQERLRELVHFDGIQAGYELDNRIAANPNTPPDALRNLLKPDQVGTHMELASNPNTPQDVLQELVDHDDEWVRRSLEANPRLSKSVRDELKARAD